ncbi:hypothetical protein ACFOD1_07555 [Pseudidiomarina halophila]|uniref:Uncharacterized protein n=1 Tax=Pseudidiomarina halophila TaxID=1449799 RepID=A0A432XR95_9GAMM|nr:hypothetical protein CWI69_12010 [Pseudidiomarina halophila]
MKLEEAIKEIGKVKLNKPSLFSILLVIASLKYDFESDRLVNVLDDFRENVARAKTKQSSGDTLKDYLYQEYLLRTSSAVNDVKSVVYRNFFFLYLLNEKGLLDPGLRSKVEQAASSLRETV